MIDKFERLSHKPTRFGEANLMAALESVMVLEQSKMCSVNILTDSSELANAVQLAGNEGVSGNDPLNLVYLTTTPLPLHDGDEPLIAPMDPEFAGEIYTDYSLKIFGFSGIPSFGTLSHIVYGIRSIEGIQKGILGLHAAVIHDREINACHLLVGPTKSGKSTLGKELERSNHDRFTLLGDDWAEVNMITGAVEVVSPVFSPSNPDAGTSPLFESFRKPYYKRPEFLDIDQSKLRVATVTELHPQEGLDRQTFIRKSMSAMPFIISDDVSSLKVPKLHLGNSDSHLVHLIQYRMQHYRDMYDQLLSNNGLPHLVNDRSEGVEDLARQIYNEVNYR